MIDLKCINMYNNNKYLNMHIRKEANKYLEIRKLNEKYKLLLN